MLLIHRPGSANGCDDVAEAFQHLHQSGKVRLGVLILRQRTYVAAIALAVHPRRPIRWRSAGSSAFVADGTLDQLQQLRIRPMARHMFWRRSVANDEAGQPLRREPSVIAQVKLNASSIASGLCPDFYACRRSRCRLLPGKIERVRAALEAETLSLSRQQWFLNRARRHVGDAPQSSTVLTFRQRLLP